ncbi:hypothetical protein [Chitinophaga sp. CF418]|uniref:hypothetical protein n=1 Tax=Chitinophaga sp. CF418 TaxID=1855287 RepID=UPI0009196E78|nr:hypothetical protein [Chitinophaga sp. CF418]SHN45480.1 hypothetical protein SAMN05216311_12069 [Chitinophaga sp. CF418]
MGPISSFFKKEKDPFFKEGKVEGKVETAIAMKKHGYKIEDIVKVGKLSVEQIIQAK